MSELYLVTGTSVLTEQMYEDYGGNFMSTSTIPQRGAAYNIAEQFAIQEIGTFLVPTTLTGTYAWPYDYRYKLPYDRVQSIGSVVAIYDQGCDCADNALELTGCAWLMDSDNGVIDLKECGDSVNNNSAVCNGCGNRGMPIQFRIAYTVGIPAGQVAATPSAIMGLVTAADLAIEQIVDPSGADGGPGDPSVSNWSDTGESHTRQFLRMTAFGGSPRANYAARMLRPLKFHGALKL